MHLGLVLSRAINEVITIGDDIRVTVVDIRGPNVRLGVLAPKSLPVYRLEVFESLRRENAGNPATAENPQTAHDIIADARKRVLEAEPKISEVSLLNQMLGMFAQQLVESRREIAELKGSSEQ